MSSPIRILIAALGGEGGGVLAGWISDAAVIDGYAAQRTSVPGVAQRTGATTYYLEIIKTDGRRPVLALSPTPGQVDLLIATEALEAARQANAGLVTPERTRVVVSTHRVYTIHEKIALADGRADDTALQSILQRFAKSVIAADVARVAREHKSHVNAVLLGIAANLLPLSVDSYRAAIERDGRAVEANLRGFDAGRSVEVGAPAPWVPAHEDAGVPRTTPRAAEAPSDLAGVPPGAHEIVREGVRRLTDFQSAGYAQRYIAYVRGFGALPGASDALVAALARNLAVRMTSEDVVRVAQLKLRDSRIARVQAEARARPGDIVRITEYLKPGWSELLSMLPPPMAGAAMKLVRAVGAERLSVPLRIHTTGVSGQILLRSLAALRPIRPHSLRARDEGRWVEEWLSLVERAQAVDPALAFEVIETARLVRGYGETWERGHRNWRTIVDAVVLPGLACIADPGRLADAILQARLAAQADDTGQRLAALVAALSHSSAGPRQSSG